MQMKISTKCSALVRLGDEFSSLSPFLPSLLPSCLFVLFADGMNELHQQELFSGTPEIRTDSFSAGLWTLDSALVWF